MRVIDTRSGQFVYINPKDRRVKYAILSHIWDPDGEQTYQELKDIQKQYVSVTEIQHSPTRDAPRQVRGWAWIAQLVAIALSSKSAERRRKSPPTHALSQPAHKLSTPPATSHSICPPSISSLSLSQPPDMWDDPELSHKMKEACRIAREDGYDYLWIDSCCIDKSSSSELSETINSMYQWYARAEVCYVFLLDVPAEEDHRQWGSRFRKSLWFTRGWTLQELLAPVDVQFLSQEWTFIGSKHSLADLVVEITRIDYNALLHIEPLDRFSVAQRLSWAAERKTTRVEDRAYSLLGIFDINMPMLYGEGDHAFRRLQEEIMRRSPDQSLLAWSLYGLRDPLPEFFCPDATTADEDSATMVTLLEAPFSPLAPSVSFFGNCTEIEALSHDEIARRLRIRASDLPTTDYNFTPHGIRVQLPVISFSDYFPSEYAYEEHATIPFSQWYLIILGCGCKDFPGHLLARVCYTQSPGSSIEVLRSGWISIGQHRFDLLPISPANIARLHSSGGQISMKSLYIPQPEREQGDDVARSKRHETIKLVLLETTRDALSAHGYTATLRGPDEVHSRTHSVTLSHHTHTVTVDYHHTLKEHVHDSGRETQTLAIKAHVTTSGPTPQESSDDYLRDPHADGLDTPRLVWEDEMEWKKNLGFQDVKLNIPGSVASTVILRLGLTLATMNHYLLHIELTGKKDDQP